MGTKILLVVIGFEAQRIFRTNKHGMDFVALELIKALQKLDTENSYVVFTNEGPDTDCLSESPNLKIVGFKGSYAIWEQYLLPKAVLKHNCDILHCTSNTAPVFSPVPTVITLHDIIYFETNPLWSKGYNTYQRFGNYYRRLVVRQNLKRVKKIVTVSNFERQRLLDFLGLPETKLEVVYNGVGSHFFDPMEPTKVKQIVEKYDLPDRYFLFLGNTDPKKNTAKTILSYAEYIRRYGSSYKLVVADLDSQMILELLNNNGYAEAYKHIHFTGYIHNRDLPYVINGATIFLYPSKRESFGIPILESMACRTAVITSDAASMPEVAGGHALLVNPNNMEDIVQTIDQLESDTQLRERLEQEGRDHARKFNWDNAAQQMLNIYKNLIK